MVLPLPLTEYAIGDAPLLIGEFRARATDVLANPTTVVVKVRPPSGTVIAYSTSSTPAVIAVSTGVFSLQLPVVTQAGDWFYRFEGTGDLVDAEEQRFTVLASAFTAAPAPTARQWVSGQSLVGDTRLVGADMPPGVTFDMCAEAATDYLYARSGRRFRLHDVVIRPNQAGCGCSVGCGEMEIELPAPVVADSLVITIDGVLLDSSAYRVYGGYLLVRTDGSPWPLCAHLSSPGGIDWSIALAHGQSPPMNGILACRELAIHIALALSGKQSKIPARATSVSRGGVSINLMRGQSTGIPLVDDFLKAVNPNGLMGRGSVTSPDTIRLSPIGTPGIGSPEDTVLYGGDSST